MTTTTLKVKNGTIKLPKELQKSWKQAEVYVSGDQDMVTLKKFSKPSLSFGKMIDEFQKATKRAGLSSKDILNEIQAVRKQHR